MEQRPIDDVFLSGVQKQIEAASLTIAQALRKGTDIELRIDTFGHLRLVEIHKKSLNYR